MQQVILGGQSQSVILEAGYALKVSAASQWTSARLRRPEITTLTGDGVWTVPLGASKQFGPFPKPVQFIVDAVGGGDKVTYDIFKAPFNAATEVGNIEGFTGSFTLKNEDNGKVFRCDDASNVTITVPNSLIEGFNVGFVQWAAGSITLTAASGATKRAGGSATSAQYQRGSLIVIKNTNAASAEYVVGGDFV